MFGIMKFEIYTASTDRLPALITVVLRVAGVQELHLTPSH